jgi:tetratricopeptide (TPR) repeat protein
MKKLVHLKYILLATIILFSCQHPTPKIKDDGEKAFNVPAQLDSINKLIRTDSLNPDNYYYRSLYFLGQKDANSALADINRSIQLDGNSSDYFEALAEIYLLEGRIPNCLESLKKSEELDAKNNKTLLKLAEVYLILKDYQNTFEYTKRALDLDKMNPKAHFFRAYAYMELGDSNLAIQNFQAAADQDQNYYEAYLELGALYAAQGNSLAAGYLQTATMIQPGREEAYYLLGMTYQDQENIPKAIETYEKLLSISPDFKEAYYNLGYINLVYLNEFEAAAGYFTKAIALDAKYTDAYFNRGYSYELMGDFVNARKDYQKALELVPNYERAIAGLNRLDNGN